MEGCFQPIICYGINRANQQTFWLAVKLASNYSQLALITTTVYMTGGVTNCIQPKLLQTIRNCMLLSFFLSLHNYHFITNSNKRQYYGMSAAASATATTTTFGQWWANPKSNLTCQIQNLQTSNLKSLMPNPNPKSKKMSESQIFSTQISNLMPVNDRRLISFQYSQFAKFGWLYVLLYDQCCILSSSDSTVDVDSLLWRARMIAPATL